MSLFSTLLGILGNNFQIGGPSGPQFKNTSGVIAARNAADNAYAIVQVANAVNDFDAVNLLTMATYSSKPIPCTVQISGASAVPTNSTTVQWYVVSTSGVNASIGQIYYDDGSNSGNCTLFSAASYGTIFTPSALSGGTVTFSAGTYYYWTGSAWTAQTVTVAGAVYQTTVTIGTSATYSSTAQIAANAIINRVHTKVTTGYSGGATISVGITGTATLFAGTADSVATTIDEYSKLQHTSVGGSAATALVTIGGSPSVGAGTVDICWSVPLT